MKSKIESFIENLKHTRIHKIFQRLIKFVENGDKILFFEEDKIWSAKHTFGP
jgi:hypothetical protein